MVLHKGCGSGFFDEDMEEISDLRVFAIHGGLPELVGGSLGAVEMRFEFYNKELYFA